MVERAWFRLIVRALGILFLGLGTSELISFGHRLYMQVYYEHAAGSTTPLLPWVSYGISTLVQPAIGVYLLFFAEGLIRLCLRDSLGRCAYCTFDLRGVKGDVCPECGSPLAPQRAVSGDAIHGGEGKAADRP